ncbi:MAG: response regulator [Candidatus Krumholzibacteriia bacterium]
MSHVESLQTSLPGGARAVVIDDSATMRRIFERELSGLGLAVQAYNDGREALLALESTIDGTTIIFSDIQMPSMDGFEFCWRLQQAPWYDGTPLVMVSTLSDASSVIRVLKLGADDFIPKPFNREDLAQIIERVLSHD